MPAGNDPFLRKTVNRRADGQTETADFIGLRALRRSN